MSSLAPQRPAWVVAPAPGCATGAGQRAMSLSLLRARIRGLPGIELPDPPPTGRARVPLRLRIDVRGTGRTGYELGRRMRTFSGVPLEYCEDGAVIAVFDDGDDISTRGSRLLLALTHALTV
jgi:hypothetical protein